MDMNFSGNNAVMVYGIIAILAVALILFFVYTYFIKKKGDLLLSKAKQAERYEQEVAITEREVKQRTLYDIGRELHDDLGQKLSVVRLLNSQLLANLSKEENRVNLLAINDLIGECIHDIRNLSKSFILDEVSDFRLMANLKLEAQRINKLDQVEFELFYNKEDIEVPQNDKLMLFRVTQELIGNTLQHSSPKKLTLEVIDMEDRLDISLKDDGKVLKLNEDAKEIGLKKIINRINMLKADISIEPYKDGGSEIMITYYKKSKANGKGLN